MKIKEEPVSDQSTAEQGAEPSPPRRAMRVQVVRLHATDGKVAESHRELVDSPKGKASEEQDCLQEVKEEPVSEEASAARKPKSKKSRKESHKN